MKILVAIPSMDTVPALFAQCVAMLKMPEGSEAMISFQVGSLVYDARNILAKNAISMEADYVFWLDSDMLFKPDVLVNMMATLKANDLDILSGIYVRRKEPYTPVLYDKLDIDNRGECRWSEFRELPSSGLFKAGGIGFGCCLMTTDVLMDVSGKHGNMFAPIGGTGEDLSFCWRARECGYDIWIDSSIKLGHIGQHVFTLDYYDAYRRAKK